MEDAIIIIISLLGLVKPIAFIFKQKEGVGKRVIFFSFNDRKKN